jgi:hypothetical protein
MFIIPAGDDRTLLQAYYPGYCIALLKKKKQEKNKALKMSTTKPFSQWTVIAPCEFFKERGVRSSGVKAQLVYRWH